MAGVPLLIPKWIINAINSLKSDVSGLNDNLTDNNKSFKFGYDSENDQYGYYKEEAGADTFVPFKNGGGAVLIGTYSSNDTADVSAYSPSSASEFILVPTTSSTKSASIGVPYNVPCTSISATASFTIGSLVLNGTNLNITLPTFSGSGSGGSNYGPLGTATALDVITCALYYIG